jgi:hypothetical protein
MALDSRASAASRAATSVASWIANAMSCCHSAVAARPPGSRVAARQPCAACSRPLLAPSALARQRREMAARASRRAAACARRRRRCRKPQQQAAAQQQPHASGRAARPAGALQHGVARALGSARVQRHAALGGGAHDVDQHTPATRVESSTDVACSVRAHARVALDHMNDSTSSLAWNTLHSDTSAVPRMRRRVLPLEPQSGCSPLRLEEAPLPVFEQPALARHAGQIQAGAVFVHRRCRYRCRSPPPPHRAAAPRRQRARGRRRRAAARRHARAAAPASTGARAPGPVQSLRRARPRRARPPPRPRRRCSPSPTDSAARTRRAPPRPPPSPRGSAVRRFQSQTCRRCATPPPSGGATDRSSRQTAATRRAASARCARRSTAAHSR